MQFANSALLLVDIQHDYFMRATTLDALAKGYEAWVVTDAIRAVNVKPGDDRRALAEMAQHDARLTTTRALPVSCFSWW